MRSNSCCLTPVLLLAACSTNPITGRNQLLLVSEQSAIAQSAQAYQGVLSDLNKKGKLSNDAKLIARVRLITDRLIDQAVTYRSETRDWAWSINVIDDPKTVNALCTAGGRMTLYTGLAEKIKPTDDELAQVLLGHEISHALLQHSREQISEQMAVGAGVALLGVTANDASDQKMRQTIAGLGAAAFILLPHSREAESEADRLGGLLEARAGYHPHAAVTLWEKMLKEGGGNSHTDFLSTRPAPAKRIDDLASMEGGMMPLYEAASRNRPPSRAWTTAPSNEPAR